MRTRNRLCLSLVLLVCLCVTPLATAQSTPSLVFAPDQLTLLVAGQGTVVIQMQDAQDLAGFELDLRFDPAIVAVERVERVIGTAAQPTPGRAWASLPSDGDAQTTYIQRAPGHISFGAYSFGDGNPSGPSGTLTLVRVHLRGVTEGESGLMISQALVTDSRAQSSTPSVTDGVVIVSGVGYSLFLPYIIAAQPAPSVP